LPRQMKQYTVQPGSVLIRLLAATSIIAS
jgi:hypothetical protein